MTDPYNAFLYRDDSATGGEGPLAGVTVGVKANIAVQGMPVPFRARRLRENRVAERDADVVARLREAGASDRRHAQHGRSGAGREDRQPAFRRDAEPASQGYSPGGSSGGSGAAVAAGLCDVALGTDTMGSVRIPAAHCGVYGFKPATARVSQDGLDPADASLDAIGPLARSLDMLERVARVISDMGSGSGDLSGATLVDHGVDIRHGGFASVSRMFWRRFRRHRRKHVCRTPCRACASPVFAACRRSWQTILPIRRT